MKQAKDPTEIAQPQPTPSQFLQKVFSQQDKGYNYATV